MHVSPVTDIQIPELQPFRTLRRSKEQYAKGLFVAEGEKVLTRLLTSGLRIRSILLTNEWFRMKQDAIAALDHPPHVYTASKATLETVVGYNLHQGIMALAELPPEPSIGEVLRKAQGPHLFLAIDDLVNAENVGVIVRNARAFGVTGVLVGETSSSPYLRRAVRNSVGSVFSLPIIHTPDLARMLADLSSHHDVRTYAAETRTGGTPIDAVDLRGNSCIVMGGEAHGVRENVLRACERVIEVPMVTGMDSLNVANATAVCLYEASRQRRG